MMRKIRYLFRFLKRMNSRKMFGTVKQIAKENKKFSAIIFLDMMWCALRYGAGYSDYLNFEFVKMPAKRRRTFVTRGINNEFIAKLNDKNECAKLEDKTSFNRLFEDYIARDWVFLKDITPEEFAEFLKDKQFVIAKPTHELCGHGVEKIDTANAVASELYEKLTESGQLLVEDFIIQHTELSRINPSSVNTVRINTIMNKDEVHVVFRGLRTGSGNSAVDNFHFGGMLAVLNSEGVIITDAVNEKNEIFSKHSTSGVIFEGTKLPFMKETEELVKAAAKRVPEIRYIGWDVAITQEKPILIEANHNPAYDFFQTRAYMQKHEYGLLPLFKKIIK